MKRSTFYIIGFFLSYATIGQNFLSWQYYDRYFSVFAGTGPVGYFGELNPENNIQTDFSHLSMGFEVRLWPKISARLESSYYQIRGDDALAPFGSYTRQRNLSFSSNNLEVNLLGVFFLKSYKNNFFDRWPIDPFLTAGVGFTTNNPTTQYQGETVKLRKLQTENIQYSGIVMVLPVSAGIKIKVSEFINVNFEMAFRFTPTDYLDDVSTVFLVSEDFSNPLAANLSNRRDEIRIVNREAYDSLIPGAARGNSSNKDHYMFMSLRFEFFLPRANGPMLSKPSVF